MKPSTTPPRADIGDRAGPLSGSTEAQLKTPKNYTVKVLRFRVTRHLDCLDPQIVDTPAAANALARQMIPDDAREHFLIFMLNTKNRLVAAHEVSVGTLSASLVHPREVFGPALRTMGVANLILIHNHPSGDPSPSAEDIRLTRELVAGARLLDLRIHDHVIVANGNDGFVSMHDRGLI